VQLVTEADELVEVKENIHSWPGSPGLECVAFPGYAMVFGKPKYWADEDDDLLYVDTTIEMHVGPHFHSIRYAAPIAWISGWSHDSSDEADATGWSVDSCTWDFDANDSPRIKLTVVAHCKGGPDARLGWLAYYVIAQGKLVSPLTLG
jgi:hypothetical protein